MPRVSVIIPTYNRRAFVREAVESVLGQDYRDFELIVVDDGSDDGTAEELAAYGDRLYYIFQENRGVSAARNHGISKAQGEYIAFLDSDDLWLPNKLATQVAFMDQHPDAQICYTDEIWIRRGVRVNPMKKHAKYTGWIYQHCLPLCIVSPSSVFMRTTLFDHVGTFDEGLPICEDYDLWLRIAARCPIHLIPQQLITKRGGHSDQLSSRSWGNDRFRVRALMKMLENGSLDDTLRDLTVNELQKKCSILINGYRKRGKENESRYYQEVLQKYTV